MSLKVLVGCKRVIDYAVKVRVRPDKTGVVTEGVKHSMNPFDEIALEEAVRLKEKQQVAKVTAISFGTQASKEVLRTALAMGADDAILVDSGQIIPGPKDVARMMESIIKKEKFDLVLLGKQAIDDDCGVVAPYLASSLDWPQGLSLSKLDIKDSHLEATCEIDGGFQTLKLKIPAVLSCGLRLNEPRYATLPAIMKAKKKPIVEMKPQDLGYDLKPNQTLTQVYEPPQREGGTRVKDIEELVTKLNALGYS